MTLAIHAKDANTAATQIALAAQDLRDRSLQGIHPTHDELVKLLAMAKAVAYHAGRTLYAANCLEQRKAPAIALVPPDPPEPKPEWLTDLVADAAIHHQPSEDTEGGHHD